MVSARQYREMADAYLKALELIEEAASLLEDQSVPASSAGEECRRKSVSVIRDTNDLCATVQGWCYYFELNAEVE